jgi:type III secretion system low calcium response chaperone LcrH/SycD
MEAETESLIQWGNQAIEKLAGEKPSLSAHNNLYTLAYALYQEKNYREALPYFRLLAQKAPFEPKFWKSLGGCLQMLKDYESALNSYTTAQILNQQNIDPYLYVYAADCYFSLNQIKEGLATLDKALEASKKQKEPRIRAHVKLMRELWSHRS